MLAGELDSDFLVPESTQFFFDRMSAGRMSEHLTIDNGQLIVQVDEFNENPLIGVLLLDFFEGHTTTVSSSSSSLE